MRMNRRAVLLIEGCGRIAVARNGKGGLLTSSVRARSAAVAAPAVDAIEGAVLAHFCAGVDVEQPPYVEGVRRALMAEAGRDALPLSPLPGQLKLRLGAGLDLLIETDGERVTAARTTHDAGDDAEFDSAVGGLVAMAREHFREGLDVTAPPYTEGLLTAVEACANAF